MPEKPLHLSQDQLSGCAFLKDRDGQLINNSDDRFYRTLYSRTKTLTSESRSGSVVHVLELDTLGDGLSFYFKYGTTTTLQVTTDFKLVATLTENTHGAAFHHPGVTTVDKFKGSKDILCEVRFNNKLIAAPRGARAEKKAATGDESQKLTAEIFKVLEDNKVNSGNDVLFAVAKILERLANAGNAQRLGGGGKKGGAALPKEEALTESEAVAATTEAVEVVAQSPTA